MNLTFADIRQRFLSKQRINDIELISLSVNLCVHFNGNVFNIIRDMEKIAKSSSFLEYAEYSFRCMVLNRICFDIPKYIKENPDWPCPFRRYLSDRYIDGMWPLHFSKKKVCLKIFNAVNVKDIFLPTKEFEYFNRKFKKRSINQLKNLIY